MTFASKVAMIANRGVGTSYAHVSYVFSTIKSSELDVAKSLIESSDITYRNRAKKDGIDPIELKKSIGVPVDVV